LAALKSEALALGFCDFKTVVIPKYWDASHHLNAFIEAGYHGQMGWLADTADRRAHPQNMWAEARSAIVLGYNYGPKSDPLANLAHSDMANISVYARGDDYHELIKKKLKSLAGFLARSGASQVKVFVDTAPLMEKPLAQLAGLGWMGKHTNLVSRSFGSWLFLSVILTDALLPEDQPEADHCGTCSACLDVCPTKAFVAPYKLDARACLSYLTIEHKGAWPVRFRKLMGNRIYGCDDCLAVCPWNRFAHAASDIKLASREGFDGLSLTDLVQLDDASFRTMFSKSPIKRIGLGSFLRNINYALGNHLNKHYELPGNKTVLDILKLSLSHDLPVVRGASIWALRQGLSDVDFTNLTDRYRPFELAPDVIEEWDGAVL
jgi:epoxyqueuosine reductase